jgi:hypothetical protein
MVDVGELEDVPPDLIFYMRQSVLASLLQHDGNGELVVLLLEKREDEPTM